MGDEDADYRGYQQAWSLTLDSDAATLMASVNMSAEAPGPLNRKEAVMGAANFNPVTNAASGSGQYLFAFAVADNLNGVPNAAVFYDQNGQLLFDNTGVTTNALAGGAAVTAPKPGSDHKWLVLNTGADGSLYAQTVDLALPGYGNNDQPMGEVTAKNQLLAAGPFIGGMTVLADHTGGAERLLLYLLGLNETGQTSLQSYLLDENMIVTPQYQGEAFELNPEAAVLIRLSGDGNQLAVVTAKGEIGSLYGLAAGGGEIRYYTLDAQTRIPAQVSTEAIDEQLLVNSAEWDADNLTLVYATMDAVNGYQLHRNTGFTYNEALTKPVTLARGANNKLYVNSSNLENLYQLAADQLLPTTTGLAGYTFTGLVPQQSHFVRDKDPVEINLYSRALGNKRYELTDHLGNVRATISDRLYLHNGTYEADLQSTANYYPFGMTIGSLSYGSEGYRFGFNGKEKDNEWHGSTGTIYDYGFRIYDTRIAKFLSVDPLTKDYPQLTPYQFAGNMPIIAIDLDGLEPLFVITGVTEAKSQVGQTGHRRGEYFMYRVEIYEDMTIDDYNRAYNNGLLRNPDATTVLARDAWNDATRTSVRYSSNNELPPGEGYLNYWESNSPGSFKLYFGDEQKGSTNTTVINGETYTNDRVVDGSGDARGGVAVHKWSPHDAQGCNTTGSNLESSVDDFIDLSPGLQEHGYGFYINEERPATYDSEDQIWKGDENYQRPTPQWLQNYLNENTTRRDNTNVQIINTTE